MKYLSLCLLLISGLAFAVPNFSDYPAGPKRHQTFFNYLRPLIEQANRQIMLKRRKLEMLYHIKFIKNKDLTPEQITWTKNLFIHYGLTISDQKSAWQALLERVDIVPTSLALAQAANETAYGTTRFAKYANNFYGTWCYSTGCGLVPKERPAGETYEIRKYSSIANSISSYMLNLNTNSHYRILRKLRAQERSFGKRPSGVILASGLLSYSQLREVYVESVQKIIIKNKLENTIDYNS